MSARSLRSILAPLPPDFQVPVGWVLDHLPAGSDPVEARPEPPLPAEWTWRERLWHCPAETRLGTEELAEALGRSRSWIHHRTGDKAESRIPHRKLDGTLVFLAGEVRAWIREAEETVVAGESYTPTAVRRLEVA